MSSDDKGLGGGGAFAGQHAKLAASLLAELLARNELGTLDAFASYLCVPLLYGATGGGVSPRAPPCSLGVLLRQARRLEEARATLLASVRAFPLNWSAWTELGHCVEVRWGAARGGLGSLPPMHDCR